MRPGVSLVEEDPKPKYKAYPVLAKRICDFLNEALQADRIGITALFNVFVSCGHGTTMHPTIQVRENRCFGVLGLLNGIVGVNSVNWGIIQAIVDDRTHEVLRFEVVGLAQVKGEEL